MAEHRGRRPSHGDIHGPHERVLAVAAAPALGALLCADEADADVPTARRVGLLLARMCAEAPDDSAYLWGAAFADGRFAAFLSAPSSAFARACSTTPLTSEKR